MLGAEGRGIYYILISYLWILILIGCLGLEVSNVYSGTRNAEDRPSIFWNSVITGAILGSLLIPAGWAVFSVVPQAFKDVAPGLLFLALLVLPWMMVSRFLIGLTVGLQHIAFFNTLNVLECLIRSGELCHELGRRGRAYVEKHHDAQRIAYQLAGIYRELLAKQGQA